MKKRTKEIEKYWTGPQEKCRPLPWVGRICFYCCYSGPSLRVFITQPSKEMQCWKRFMDNVNLKSFSEWLWSITDAIRLDGRSKSANKGDFEVITRKVNTTLNGGAICWRLVDDGKVDIAEKTFPRNPFSVFREINFNLRNNFCCQVSPTEAENHSFSCGHNNFLNFLKQKAPSRWRHSQTLPGTKKRPIHLPNGEVSDRLRGADCAVGVCRRKAQNICDSRCHSHS